MPSPVEKIRDRRANGRIGVSYPVELRDDSCEFLGRLVDLSPSGVRVRVPDAEIELNQDYDLVVRPPGEPPRNLKGRVMHVAGNEAGIALATGDARVFETAFELYDAAVFRDPKLALRLKRRPSTLELTQRLWPLPLGGAVLSGPEHWVYGSLKPGGTLLSELKQAVGAEWPRLSYVPFMLVERGLVSLSEPLQPVEDHPGRPVTQQQAGPGGQARSPAPSPRREAAVVAPGARKPGR